MHGDVTGGVNWQSQNQGLSLLNCSSLSIDPHNPALLYLGTGGNGAFIGTDGAIAAKTSGRLQAVPNSSPALR
jgi:hypothetical protein